VASEYQVKDELLVAFDDAILAVMAPRALRVVHHHLKGAAHTRVHFHTAGPDCTGTHPLREALGFQPGIEEFIDRWRRWCA
jgi:hypothetical protein